MAILQHTAQEIAVLASSDITRPRDLDGKTYAGFGYPQRGADAEVGHQGRRRQGHVQDRHPRHRGVRRALRQARRLRDHLRGVGGHRGRRARDRAPDLRLRRLRLPRLLPGRPRLRQPLAGRAPRPGPRVRRRDRPRLRDRGRRPRRRQPPSSSRRTRASSTATRHCRRRARSSSRRAATCATRTGAVGRQTLAEWQGYSGFLYDQDLLTGPDGKPLTAAARLRGAVHQRLPAVTAGPAPAVAAGARRSSWSA